MTVVSLNYTGGDQLVGWALNHAEHGVRPWTIRATRGEVRDQRDKLTHVEARSHKIVRVCVESHAVVLLA